MREQKHHDHNEVLEHNTQQSHPDISNIVTIFHAACTNNSATAATVATITIAFMIVTIGISGK